MTQSPTSLIIIQFAIATLLPVVIAATLTLLERRTRFSQLAFWPKQVLIGLIYGCVAIYGTEAGIATQGATMNVRDAAPLVAGLYFGGPAGIIAGIVGGVERWFAALWGRGMFTRVACSTATVAVGFYAAILRRHLFDDRKPSWPIAMGIGAVAEVLHLLLVFLTNMDQTTRAFYVVQACTFPMVGCNALATALSSIAIGIAAGRKGRSKSEAKDISSRIQTGMLGVVVIGFVATVGFVSALEASFASTDTHDRLQQELDETEDDIRDASDANLLALAQRAAQSIPSVSGADQAAIDKLVSSLNLAEIHVVDENGIIVASSDASYLGFDMSSGEQSYAFLSLLPGGNKSSLVQEYQPISMDDSIWRKYAGVSIEGGLLQVGYDATRFVKDLTDKVRVAVANRHVGREGILVVLTERGALVGTHVNRRISHEDAQNLSATMDIQEPGEVYELTLLGTEYLAMYRSTEGLRVLALLPRSEAVLGKSLTVLVTSFMEVLVFATLFLAIYVLIRRVVVRSIWQVNGRLGQITCGDLNVEVDVRDSSEFASLSDDINGTVAALRDAISAEARRNESDLATAKAIQESALPRNFPPFPDIKAFDIYASMNAAREVGGDFYDFFLIDEHILAFLIADVSGKGIPASLFMMEAKSELANHIKSGMRLAEAVHRANWSLCEGNDAGMFVTVWAATLDYATGELTYVNAGHNFPLLRHKGRWQWLTKRCGLFLGTYETAKYRQETLALAPGDELLLYTDGVNEAFNADEEEYGNDRLESFLQDHTDLSPHMLVDVLGADVRRWAQGAEQSDDITMLCLEYGAPPEISGALTVPATGEGLEELQRRVQHELEQLQCPPTARRQIEHTVEELFSNVCTHGYAESDEPGQVQLAYIYDATGPAVTMTITDWGAPFDPTTYRREDAEDVADEVVGMGIALAVDNIDDIAYIRDADSNVVAFRKIW